MHDIYIARYIASDGKDHFLEFKDLSEAIKEMFYFESKGCRIISVTDLYHNEYFCHSGRDLTSDRGEVTGRILNGSGHVSTD